MRKKRKRREAGGKRALFQRAAEGHVANTQMVRRGRGVNHYFPGERTPAGIPPPSVLRVFILTEEGPEGGRVSRKRSRAT